MGAFSEFWEENSWWPLIAKRLGAAAPSIQATPAGYTGASSSLEALPGASAHGDPRRQRRAENHPPSVVTAPTAAPQLKKVVCKNCQGEGHQWWNCTPITGFPLDERLATQLARENAAKGKGPAGKGRGAGGKGKEKGGKGKDKGKKGKDKGKHKGGKGPAAHNE